MAGTRLRSIKIGKRGRTALGDLQRDSSRSTLEELHVRPQLIDRDRFPHRVSAHIRSPWMITSTLWKRQGRFISLYINPSETSWSMPRRETFTKTKAGLVRNVWRNRYRKSYYDEFTINLSFQSGNIMPGAPYSPSENSVSRLSNPSLPTGLGNFYEFMAMLDQPALLGTEENRHIIYYHSRIFPQIKLEGYFINEPMNFTDSAVNGNTVQWTHTFRVYKTSPRINSFDDMSRVYWNWVRERANTEVADPVELALDLLAVARQQTMPETVQTVPRKSTDSLTTAQIFAGAPVI